MATDLTNGMALRDEQRQLATEAPGNPWAGVALLTPHGGPQRPVRIESIATISAGYRNQSGLPVISRDGTIYVSDDPINQATGLREALAARDNKALTIAFSTNDPSQIIQQRLTLYSKTRLEAHGDHERIILISERGDRTVIRKDSEPERYAEQAAKMKAETFVYFFLARWLPNGDPEIYLPDGFASYRLRFTSLNSAQSIVNQLYFISEKTGGQVAGIPLDLFITYRELADPTGAKRKVPIWTMVLRPPESLQLNTAAAVRGIFRKGIAQAEALSLPAPTMLTDDQLMLEAPDVDLDDPSVIDGQFSVSEADNRRLRGGGPIANPDRLRSAFFLAIRGSSLDDREGGDGYEDFLLAVTKGRTGSLAEFCRTATNAEADELLEAVVDRVRREREARTEPPQVVPLTPEQQAKLARTRQLLDEACGEEVAPPVRPLETPQSVVVSPEVQAAVALTDGPPVKPEPARALPDRPVDGQSYRRDDWLAWYRVHFARLKALDSAQQPVDVERLENGALKSAVLRVIAEADEIEQIANMADDDAEDAG